MNSFFIGIVLGLVLIGASVERTLCVHKGESFKALIFNLLSALGHFASIMYVVKDDYPGIIGTCVGSSIVVLILSYRNNRTRRILREKNKNL